MEQQCHSGHDQDLGFHKPMATSDETAEEVQKVDSSTIDARLTPAAVDRSKLGHLWWYLRRYPVIPVFVLVILVIAAVIGPTVAPYERDIGVVQDRHLGM